LNIEIIGATTSIKSIGNDSKLIENNLFVMIESVDTELLNLNELLNEERLKFTEESFKSLKNIYQSTNEAYDQTFKLLRKANKNVYKLSTIQYNFQII
jgi:hypothetical protein